MAGDAYVRHKIGEERRSPKGRFPALADDHPLVGEACPECHGAFNGGDAVTLLVIEPADEEQAAKANNGQHYTALAATLHEGCAYQ